MYNKRMILRANRNSSNKLKNNRGVTYCINSTE